jgi:hypothetical protein
MTKYFFDINNGKLAKNLFKGTELENDKEFVKRTCGQFPVISISFLECRADNWNKMEAMLRGVISRAYKDHQYLLERHWWNFWKSSLTPEEQYIFKKILKQETLETPDKKDSLYEFALRNLTQLLHRYHNKRAIVLIDEYDVPVNEAYTYDYYDQAISFLTSAFTGALKDNPFLEKGLLTGVLRVAKAGYLTGLNNLRVYSLLDKRFADKYGVTQDELREALEKEGLSEKVDEVKGYYNGYSTAYPDIPLYNPWSVLNFLADKVLKPYWIETGKTNFVANTMWSSPLTVRQAIIKLLNGETVQVPFEVDINYKALDDERALWSLLYFSGYITGEKAEGDNLRARIPNLEVRREIAVMWRRVIEDKKLGGYYREFISALLTGNQPIFEEHLRSLALKFSVHDLARTPEAWYHAFMLSALFPLEENGYQLITNHEAGYGRPDIVIIPPVGKPAVVLEFGTRTNPEEKD